MFYLCSFNPTYDKDEINKLTYYYQNQVQIILLICRMIELVSSGISEIIILYQTTEECSNLRMNDVVYITAQKKKFPLRISIVNVTKSV